jgi:C_GCAxxG_C_C family probable redox protein
MSTKNAIINKALHYFNIEGWNCAESVYMAIFKEYYKIDVTPKTVTAFGGGIARTGSICGAVNVAIMGISQKYGRTSPKQPFIRTQRPVFQFLNKILDQYGSLSCAKLKQSQHDKLEDKVREKDAKENLCTPLIKTVIQTFLSIAENNNQSHT